MKALKLARALFVACALVSSGAAVYATSVLQTPSVSGPSLGDPNTNLYTVVQGLQNNNVTNFFSFTTLTVNAGQTTSTILNYGMNFLTAAIGATGTMVMPVAKGGTEMFIANNTGNGVALFGSATPFTVGGQDYINNVAGNNLQAGGGAYAIPNAQSAQCFAPANGSWWCSTGK